MNKILKRTREEDCHVIFSIQPEMTKLCQRRITIKFLDFNHLKVHEISKNKKLSTYSRFFQVFI